MTSSHDAGKTLAQASVGDDQADIASVVGVGRSDVYAAGYTHDFAYVQYTHPFVAISHDGGATFTPSYPPFSGALFGITADSHGVLLAVGYATDGGFFVRSTDGATTWSRTVIPGASYMAGIWRAADGTIYACGQAAAAAPADGGVHAGEAVDGGSPDGGESEAPGVVVRSMDDGATWSLVATAPLPLLAMSGTPDGARMMAVGFGYTVIEQPAGSTGWVLRSDDPTRANSGEGVLNSVWIPDTTSPAYMTMGNQGYVLRGASAVPGGTVMTSSEALPDIYAGLDHIAPGANAVTGTSPTDVWAAGSGIFRKTRVR